MALTAREVHLIVSEYIGVDGGYLGDFSYRTHQEFYPAFCDLDIDVAQLREERGGGTTRELFVEILKAAEPRDQARIIRGVLDKYPPEKARPEAREERERLAAKLEQLAARLESAAAVVAMPEVAVSHEAVTRAIADAEQLLRSNGAVSALDRVHTALHGYLRHLADEGSVTLEDDASIPTIWSVLFREHAAFQALTHRADEIRRLLRSASGILDALNTLRNRASVAHVNDLIGEPEAALAINIARSLVHYAESRLRGDGE